MDIAENLCSRVFMCLCPSILKNRPHVAVFLALCGLLAVIGGLSVHDAELFSIKANLAERLRVSGDKLSSVSAERDQLKDKVTALTQEKDGLQLLLKQKKTCPEGWTMFRGSCYLLSTRDDSWENGRKDCRDQGADLVIIDSLEEQKFLSSINRRRSWIGLSDKDIEGTWKWIDGTPLTAAYWYRDANVVEPNNGGGGSTVEEDCAEMNPDLKTQNSWNDLPCNTALRWICEKLA
uniref:C-type lectin domain-containing protein n=1 Tax=Gasterosteus aculeatus aculeatus TaxID=481459 RepID=A0AAQ4RCF9_GASAC